MKQQTFSNTLTVLTILAFVIMVAVAGTYFQYQKQIESSMDYYDYTVMKFEGMNETEKDAARELVYDIEPIYHSKFKEITFTKDQNACDEVKGVTCIAYNRNKKEILVEWGLPKESYPNKTATVEESKSVAGLFLCHEVLHSFFKPTKGMDSEDPVHMALSEASSKDVCYKEDMSMLGSNVQVGDYPWEEHINVSYPSDNRIEFEYPIEEKYKINQGTN